PRFVDPDADDDRDDPEQTKKVDQRPVSGQRRDEEVGGSQGTGGAEVPRPGVVAPVAAGLAKAHAARSARVDGWRSNLFASLPSTSTRRSISASVFAAVI